MYHYVHKINRQMQRPNVKTENKQRYDLTLQTEDNKSLCWYKKIIPLQRIWAQKICQSEIDIQ